MPRAKHDTTQAKRQRRDKHLDVRLTADEETALRDRAKERGLTLSDFVRQAALAVKPRRVQATPERAAMIRGLAELGKIGGNVNQIARALNQQQTSGFKMHIKPEVIENALYGVQALSANLLKVLSNGD